MLPAFLKPLFNTSYLAEKFTNSVALALGMALVAGGGAVGIGLTIPAMVLATLFKRRRFALLAGAIPIGGLYAHPLNNHHVAENIALGICILTGVAAAIVGLLAYEASASLVEHIKMNSPCKRKDMCGTIFLYAVIYFLGTFLVIAVFQGIATQTL